MTTEILKNYCIDKGLSESLKGDLLSLDSESQQSLVLLINELLPSANSFRQIFDLMWEISKRDRISISEVIALKEVRMVSGESAIARKEKLALLRDSLERVRFPEKFALLNQANSLAEEIRKSYSCRVFLPDELEGDSIEMSFTIKSGDDLGDKIMRLSELNKSGKMHNLFNLLLGRD